MSYCVFNCIVHVACPQTEIVENPQSVLGYAGRRVSFKCTVKVPNHILWYLNEQTLPSKPVPPYRASISWSVNWTSILTVDASAQTNNTVVICRTINLVTLQYWNSPGVQLTVQGEL